jgi:signal transduction histidine kinase
VDRVRASVERALSERQIVHYRTVGAGEGAPAHYESIVVPIAEPDGSLGYCLIALDVTRQVERERALEESEAKLRLAVESTSLGIFSWDPDRRARSIKQGEHSGVVGGLLDVTQQRLFDEGLRKAQRMNAIGNLTAGVAHHFNDMLAAILPVLELFRSAAPDSLARYVEHAEQAGARAAELVRQLMTFAGQRGASAPTAQAPREIVGRACRSAVTLSTAASSSPNASTTGSATFSATRG